MRILFVLKESIYDCSLQITDANGSRCYRIPALNNDTETAEPSVIVDVWGESCDVTVIPLVPDYRKELNALEEDTWKDKVAKKTAKVMLASMENMFLRVGCSYCLRGLTDGDRVDIRLQRHVFGSFDRFDLLDLIPVAYQFFEVSQFNTRFEPIGAFATNREEVVTSARTLELVGSLANGPLASLLIYPIQVGRIKRLSKNKKVFRVISKLHRMSDEKRKKWLEKQEAFLDR